MLLPRTAQQKHGTIRSSREIGHNPTDQPTIGLILCQTKDNVLAEYALSGIDKPIGVSSYELTRALPKTLQSALPTVEQIEAELEKVPEIKKPPAPSKPKQRRRRSKRKRTSDVE